MVKNKIRLLSAVSPLAKFIASLSALSLLAGSVGWLRTDAATAAGAHLPLHIFPVSMTALAVGLALLYDITAAARKKRKFAVSCRQQWRVKNEERLLLNREQREVRERFLRQELGEIREEFKSARAEKEAHWRETVKGELTLRDRVAREHRENEAVTAYIVAALEKDRLHYFFQQTGSRSSDAWPPGHSPA